MNNYSVYLLIHPTKISYIGITNNIERRIKQHNKILKGGAKFTTRKSPFWRLKKIINNLTKSEACILEYKLKKYIGIINRINAFNKFINNII